MGAKAWAFIWEEDTPDQFRFGPVDWASASKVIYFLAQYHPKGTKFAHIHLLPVWTNTSVNNGDDQRTGFEAQVLSEVKHYQGEAHPSFLALQNQVNVTTFSPETIAIARWLSLDTGQEQKAAVYFNPLCFFTLMCNKERLNIKGRLSLVLVLCPRTLL